MAPGMAKDDQGEEGKTAPNGDDLGGAAGKGGEQEGIDGEPGAEEGGEGGAPSSRFEDVPTSDLELLEERTLQLGVLPALEDDGEQDLLSARRESIARLSELYRRRCKQTCDALLKQQRKWKNDLKNRGRIPRTGLVLLGSREQQLRREKFSKRWKKRFRDDDPDCPFNDSDEKMWALPEDIPYLTSRPWKKFEQEQGRKALLMFGVSENQLEKAHRHLVVLQQSKGSVASFVHGIGDVKNFAFSFLSAIRDSLEGPNAVAVSNDNNASKGESSGPKSDLDFVTQMLENLESMQGAMPTEGLVQPWQKVDKMALSWVRKLRLLDGVEDGVNLLSTDEVRGQLWQSFEQIAKEITPPADWWTPEADEALLKGVHMHGYGSYDKIREDPEFAASAFAAVAPATKQGDDGDEEDEDEVGGDPDAWPAADALTKRLKRLVDLVAKIQQKNFLSGPSSGGSRWTKGDRWTLAQTVLRWGLPGKRDSPDWEELRNLSRLRRRSADDVQTCFLDLMKEADAVLKEEQGGKGTDIHGADGDTIREEDCKEEDLEPKASLDKQNAAKTNSVLTSLSAARLRERIDSMLILREILSSPDWQWDVPAPMQSQGLPSWWNPRFHDAMLVQGVIKHGMGKWKLITSDESLIFAQKQEELDQRVCIKRIKKICTAYSSSLALKNEDKSGTDRVVKRRKSYRRATASKRSKSEA